MVDATPVWRATFDYLWARVCRACVPVTPQYQPYKKHCRSPSFSPYYPPLVFFIKGLRKPLSFRKIRSNNTNIVYVAWLIYGYLLKAAFLQSGYILMLASQNLVNSVSTLQIEIWREIVIELFSVMFQSF